MEKLMHLFLPRQSNNHKAKVLHPSSLFLIVLTYILFQSLVTYISFKRPDVLGYASNISPSEVVRLTNQKRAEAGLSALIFNQTLSNAAYTKGRDMIDRDYWAHVAPDGTQPWKFFKDFGYKYHYAGENLARDFSSPSAAVDAWMNSPTHKENILNPKYKEIGIGVVEGDLAGSDTTIIVQFFGSPYTDIVKNQLADAKTIVNNDTKENIPQLQKSTTQEVKAEITTSNDDQKILISPFTTTKNTSLIVISLLIIIFIIDAFLVSRRKITRIAGRTFAHIIFLVMVLAIILILKSGKLI